MSDFQEIFGIREPTFGFWRLALGYWLSPERGWQRRFEMATRGQWGADSLSTLCSRNVLPAQRVSPPAVLRETARTKKENCIHHRDTEAQRRTIEHCGDAPKWPQEADGFRILCGLCLLCVLGIFIRPCASPASAPCQPGESLRCSIVFLCASVSPW